MASKEKFLCIPSNDTNHLIPLTELGNNTCILQTKDSYLQLLQILKDWFDEFSYLTIPEYDKITSDMIQKLNSKAEALYSVNQNVYKKHTSLNMIQNAHTTQNVFKKPHQSILSPSPQNRMRSNKKLSFSTRLFSNIYEVEDIVDTEQDDVSDFDEFENCQSNTKNGARPNSSLISNLSATTKLKSCDEIKKNDGNWNELLDEPLPGALPVAKKPEPKPSERSGSVSHKPTTKTTYVASPKSTGSRYVLFL